MSENNLKDETSPYLLQHADNPVQWYPWGAEALELARTEGLPILLSIGYSACHWCHVMAHESFEDQETAALMNRLFVNIKVDREERPDLDKIYQTAHQLLVQRGGGWPLTMFLTPDRQIPFFAGTYYPTQPRHGLPAFRDLLQGISTFYRQNREDIDRQNASLLGAMHQVAYDGGDAVTITAQPLRLFIQQMQRDFDENYCGFGGAPKFPHPSNLELLLQQHAAMVVSGGEDEGAWGMAAGTLRSMAQGGIFDQLGGGFCRYSVDEKWMIPHFEKMLYDNGQLLVLYSMAWQISADPVYAQAAHQTAEWVLREMQSPEGGYYSSLDADTAEGEGEFYVWDREEVSTQLTEDEFVVFSMRFGLDRPANFEGKWHLHACMGLDDIAERSRMEPERVSRLLASARARLLDRRNERLAPGRDEKILTSWNGLMIRGMALAGAAFNRPDWVASAERALDFVRHNLWQDGRLLATCKDGRAHLAAYLDDYAYLIDAVMALLAARWRDGDLEFAVQLADRLLNSFEDQDLGGFYFTAHDHEELFHRPKPAYDESMPAGNGIAAQVLGRLGLLLGEQRYLDAAEGVILSNWNQMEQMPGAHGSMLIALREYLDPPRIVVLRGKQDQLGQWSEQAGRGYTPGRITLAIPDTAASLPGALGEKRVQDRVVAYICEGFVCHQPISDLERFRDEMAKDEVVSV
jgi:uncharacterized protein